MAALWVGLTLMLRAEVITVKSATNTAVAERQGEASQGMLVVSKMVQNNVSDKQTFELTVSGLKLDQKGGKNDSVELTFEVDGHGKNIHTSPPDRDGWLSANGAFLSKPGSQISITFVSIKVHLNGGKSEGAGHFEGFTRVRVSGWGPTRNREGEIIQTEKNLKKKITDKALLNGIQVEYASHKDQWFKLNHVPSITLERLDGVMRLAEYDFSFIAAASRTKLDESLAARGLTSSTHVEPDQKVLLGVGGITLILNDAN